MNKELDDLLVYCKSNSRICPVPTKWNELWELLPNRSRDGSGWVPSLPLILAAWYNSSAEMKITRLEEHIRYAEKNGALKIVSDYLYSLGEENWFHIHD